MCTLNCSVEDCASCSEPNVCATCNTNFTLDPNNNTCIPNCGINYCVDCNSTTSTCNLCLTDYILLGPSCIVLCNVQNCLTCQGDAYDQCQECEIGYSLSTDSTMCVVCDIPNCVSCITNNVCGLCQGDLMPMNGQCLSCSVDNCGECSSNDTCSSSGCLQGYYFNSNFDSISTQCLACLSPCETCYSDGYCMTCQSPYSQVNIPQGNSCFLCDDPRCSICVDSEPGSC